MKTYYQLLEVKQDAPKEDIKRAFHKLAKQYHPDVADTHGAFIEILNAYKTLIDDEKRLSYNNALIKHASKAHTIIPKSRVSFALSLQDVARLRMLNQRGRRGRLCNPLGYHVCVHVTRSELLSGCQVLVDIPAHVVCPLCRGHRVCCNLCSDKGYILKAVPVPVDIPKDLTNKSIFSVSLREIKRKEYTFFLIKQLSVKIEILQE